MKLGVHAESGRECEDIPRPLRAFSQLRSRPWLYDDHHAPRAAGRDGGHAGEYEDRGAAPPRRSTSPRSPRRSDMGPTGIARSAGRHRGALHMGPGRVRVGQLVLLGSRAGGYEELGGILLRVVRCGQLHHRRQAPCLVVAHGAVGADLRCERVEHPGTRSAGRRGDGGRRLRRRAPVVHGWRRPHRRSDRRRHAGRRPHVPLQQPRRAARALVDGRGLRRAARRRDGEHTVADAGVVARGLRLSHQDVAGAPRRCPRSPSCTSSPRPPGWLVASVSR